MPVSGLGVEGDDTTLVVDPILVAPENGDFRLHYGSPCLDVGTALDDVTSDLPGHPRPIGNGPDLGCYEMDYADPSKLYAIFNANQTSGGGELAATFTVTLENGTTPVFYKWDFGDGQTLTVTEPTADHTFAPGTYTVALTITDSSEPHKTAKVTRLNYIHVKNVCPEVYVSDKGSDTPPYDTIEKASHSIQAAIDSVYATDEKPGIVHVASGTYSESDGKTTDCRSPMLLIEKPVHLIGMGASRDDVVLDAENKCQVLLLKHPQAMVENLTLANGKCTGFGSPNTGGNLTLLNGLVRNCVITNGFSVNFGNVYAENGSIIDSVICKGSLEVSGPDRPAAGINAYGTVLIDNCEFHDNAGGYGSALYIPWAGRGTTARNCTFYKNSNTGNGGGAVVLEGGLLESCVITSNLTWEGGGGVLLRNNTAIMRNCLIARNESKGNKYDFGYQNGGSGGGVAMSAGTVVNCTITGNKAATESGHDLFITGGKVVNTIVSPSGDVLPEKSIYKTGGAFSYCFVPSLAIEGVKNFTAENPGFRNAGKGDYRLSASSPCLDKGDDSYWQDIEKPLDLAGQPRISHRAVDVGAYEFSSILGTLMIVR